MLSIWIFFRRSMLRRSGNFLSEQSYTLGLVRSHFSQPHRHLNSSFFPTLVFVLSILLVSLLALTAAFQFIPPPTPPSTSRLNIGPHLQCRRILRTLRELIQLHNETMVMEVGREKTCVYRPTTFWWSDRVDICSPSGPYQESAKLIFQAFTSVAVSGFRNGCFFDVLLGCTEVR